VPIIAIDRTPVSAKAMEGIKLPEIETFRTIPSEREKASLFKVDTKYPLIVENGKVFASAHIYWDRNKNELLYEVFEPRLDEHSKKALELIKKYIQEKIDINFTQIRRQDASDYINKMVDRTFDFLKLKFDEATKTKIKYYIMRDFIGLEMIEPLLRDKQIEDISCDGVGIPVYVYHRDPRFNSIRTNIVFNDKAELDSFVAKIAERCEKTISVAKPLLDGTLPDGSRVQATLSSDIAIHGSNFTIRMFTETPMTPVDIIKYDTCDLRMMAYFWLLIENGASILVSGGTATGKTSFLNVLSLFIKPQMKIISIEDTAELRLPHPHWISEVARTPISEEGKVDMFELLRESLRQRPDHIVVGEVRGREAYVLFQQIATGHPGLSTIHADNFSKLIDRLTTPPISLPPSLVENVDLIIFLKRIRQGNRYIRKVSEAVEVVGFDKSTNSPLINEIFKWSAMKDEFHAHNKSVFLKKIANSLGITDAEIVEELEKRARVIKWMVNQNITDYKKIGLVLNMFYTAPETLFNRIGAV
jgi:flagellar protein FlaI